MATSFMESINEFFSSLFKTKDSSLTVTGIDIGSSSIKLVELSSKNGRVILNTYGSIALGPYANSAIGSTPSVNPEIISQAINELFNETKASKENIAVALPTGASLLRDIYIPASITMPDEVKTVVMTEARHVIPVPIQDVEIDWLSIPNDILPKESTDPLKRYFLLIAVSHESQRRYESYMKASNINPSMYELEVFSSMRSVYTHERAPIVLIDLGALHIKISIIHEGVVRRAVSLDRGFNELENSLVVGGSTFEEARKIKHSASINGLSLDEKSFRDVYISLIKDVQSVINEYERYSHVSVSRAVVLGGGAEMNGIIEFTESILGIPTQKSKPFARAVVPDIVKDVIGSIEPEFTIATGIALRILAK